MYSTEAIIIISLITFSLGIVCGLICGFINGYSRALDDSGILHGEDAKRFYENKKSNK